MEQIKTMEQMKTMEQIKTVNRRRNRMMASGACIIFFTGFPHVWSIFQPYVMEQAGWSQGQASMCFYLSLAAFVFGNIIGGRMQDGGNPQKVLWNGGLLFSAGILFSAFLITPSPVFFYITYGIMQGFGQGMVYTTIISTAQKWFRDRPGFASGVIVTANGLCGFFLAPVSRSLLAQGGPKLALLLIGLAIAMAWIAGYLFFAVPRQQAEGADAGTVDGMEAVVGAGAAVVTESVSESGSAVVTGSAHKPGSADETEAAGKRRFAGYRQESENQRQYTSGEMIRTRKFYYLLLTMLFGLLSYFLVSPVSQSYQISLGIPEAAAVSAVMFGSVMNAGMRLALPTLADRIGRVPCIRAVLLLAAAAMAVLGTARSYGATAAVIAVYGCYGGIMGSFPAFTSSIFGIRHTGENYGYVMLGIVIATFAAPGITRLLTENGLGMQAVFLTGVAFAVLAFVCLTLLERELKKGENTWH